MDAGKVIESGSFDTLYQKGGRFTEIIRQQYGLAADMTKLVKNIEVKG
jgi:ATP-binding cassette subfamily B protein